MEVVPLLRKPRPSKARKGGPSRSGSALEQELLDDACFDSLADLSMHLSPGSISRCLARKGGSAASTPDWERPSATRPSDETQLGDLFRTACASPPSPGGQRVAHRLPRSPLVSGGLCDRASLSGSHLRRTETAATDETAAAAMLELSSPERVAPTLQRRKATVSVALPLERVRSIVAPRRLSPGLEYLPASRSCLRPDQRTSKVLLSQRLFAAASAPPMGIGEEEAAQPEGGSGPEHEDEEAKFRRRLSKLIQAPRAELESAKAAASTGAAPVADGATGTAAGVKHLPLRQSTPARVPPLTIGQQLSAINKRINDGPPVPPAQPRGQHKVGGAPATPNGGSGAKKETSPKTRRNKGGGAKQATAPRSRAARVGAAAASGVDKQQRRKLFPSKRRKGTKAEAATHAEGAVPEEGIAAAAGSSDLRLLFGDGGALGVADALASSVDPLGLLYLEPGAIASMAPSPVRRPSSVLPSPMVGGRELSAESEARAVDQLHTISVLCSESAAFLNALGNDEV